MTREKALKILKKENNHECTWSEYCEAYNMAIKALEQEPILDKIRAEIKALSPEPTAIDVSIDGECESILAEKTLYCLLSSVYDKAPGVVIHAMETFVKNKLGVNND